MGCRKMPLKPFKGLNLSKGKLYRTLKARFILIPGCEPLGALKITFNP
jgi:hypothetical protein